MGSSSAHSLGRGSVVAVAPSSARWSASWCWQELRRRCSTPTRSGSLRPARWRSGSGVGALAGFGLATALVVSSFPIASLIALAGSQIGILVPLIALWSTDDISGADLAQMGMTSTYAFVLTALTSFLFSGLSATARLSAVLFAPAFGMALGALWALGPDLAAGRVLKLTALPLGVGALTLLLGLALAGGNLQIVSAATLITTIATFGLTYFLTADDAAAPTTTPVALQPTVTMVPAGWRNEGMAVGPALVGRF